MTREYILTPRPGYSVEDAIENTNEENAIIEVYEYGSYQFSYPVNPLAMRIFKPVPHPSYQRMQRMVMREGEKVLKKPIPEEYLTTDINPFFQVIQKIVEAREEASTETIIRAIIHDFRMFKEDKEDIRIIKALIEKMHTDGLLVIVLGKFRVGLKIELGDRMIPLVKGYDPFEWEIMQLAEGRGLISGEEIHRRVMGGLKWTTNDGLIENYLKRLVHKKKLERVGDYYRFVQPLTEITGEIKEKIK